MSKTLTLLLIILLLSCNKEPEPESICYSEYYPPRSNEKVTIDQGLWGDVWFWEGDFMPDKFGTICQVKREIYIFELTMMNGAVKVKPYSSFYSSINSKLVTITESDITGFFQVELEPGLYSLFVLEGKYYYSNLFDGYGAIFPIKVESGKVAEVRFDITYDAYY
jgi:hypothetical protein